MMTDEELAQHDADEFWDYKGGGDKLDKGFDNLDYEIDSKIGQETINYQLQFLYRVQSIAAMELEAHLKKLQIPGHAK